MRREPVPQLASISCQIQGDLLQLLHHHPPCALIATELSIDEVLPLIHAAVDGPHDQVWHVVGNRL